MIMKVTTMIITMMMWKERVWRWWWRQRFERRLPWASYN